LAHVVDIVVYSVNVVVFIAVDAVHIDTAFDDRSVKVVVTDIVVALAVAIAVVTAIAAVASVESNHADEAESTIAADL